MGFIKRRKQREAEAEQARQMGLAQERSNETKAISDLRTDLEGRRQQALGIARDESRRNLASGLQDVRSAANQRGLLYSGLRRGAESDLSGQIAAQGAGRAGEINQAMQDYLSDALARRTQSGLDDYLRRANQSALDYERKLQKAGQRAQNISGIGSAVGGLLGTGVDKFAGA